MARSRPGRLSSADMKLAVCQPPYANITGVIAAAKTVPTGFELHAPSEGQVAGGGEFVKDDHTIGHRGTYDEVTGLVQRFEQPVQHGSFHQPHTARLNSVVHGTHLHGMHIRPASAQGRPARCVPPVPQRVWPPCRHHWRAPESRTRAEGPY